MVFRGRVHHLWPVFIEPRERVRINIRLCAAQDRVLNCAGANPKGHEASPRLSCDSGSLQASKLPGLGSSEIAEGQEAFGTAGLEAGATRKKRELGLEWQLVKH